MDTRVQDATVEMRRAGVVVFAMVQQRDTTAPLATAGLAHAPPAGSVVLHLLLEGRLEGRLDQAPACVHRGDVLVDDARAWTAVNGPCRVLQAIVPRDEFPGEPHGRVLLDRRTPTRMLATQMLRTFEALPSERHGDRLGFAFLAVLSLCLEFSPAAAGGRASDALRSNLLAFVDEHLDRADLSASLLQEQFGLSRTQLYALFSEMGGVQRVIRERRLDAAVATLQRNPGMRIADVAFALGFSSERQMQRAFLARFGASPSDVRAGWGREPT